MKEETIKENVQKEFYLKKIEHKEEIKALKYDYSLIPSIGVGSSFYSSSFINETFGINHRMNYSMRMPYMSNYMNSNFNHKNYPYIKNYEKKSENMNEESIKKN